MTSSTSKIVSARATCPTKYVLSSLDCAFPTIEPGNATETVYFLPGSSFFTVSKTCSLGFLLASPLLSPPSLTIAFACFSPVCGDSAGARLR
eukprot:CAMPEP_0197529324 /NCGR_PEP_ID=MMETSP1318-20131121/28043_1 /TAXON_ID=552666 /ORGANISM="Partenskyella glossopodia, Strain RCC365" /LENGTH=91 /DNA_ID=CAMNT_0043084751 /DNA_START=787 /DNA_END=1058 /DNA_ORIENTATION=-